MENKLKVEYVDIDTIKSYKNKHIILTHEPITTLKDEFINIHGHLHTKEESHRDYYNLQNNNILIESEKIYSIDELIK